MSVVRLECRSVLTALICLAVAAPFALADPLPTPQHWMGGRLVPAAAVPVDMVSEKLTATLTWHEAQRPAEDFSMRTARAEVAVSYVLRADGQATIPIVFPVVGDVGEVFFALNGATLETKTTSEVDLYSAYEKAWVAAIDRFVDGDAKLAALRKEAGAAAVPAGGAAGDGTTRVHRSSSPFMRLLPRLERRLLQLRVPWAKKLSWGLAHYLLDDWDSLGKAAVGVPAFEPRRRQLRAERELALAFDPKSPDPAALWASEQTGAAPASYATGAMSFISARLPLRRGDNALVVRYSQPTSFVNVKYKPASADKRPRPSHQQAGIFEFVLRTARFWRSFGDLQMTVKLPPGTVYAECGLPGASVKLQGPEPSVTCSLGGLPQQNVAVTFADFEVIPGPDPFDEEPTMTTDAPAMDPKLVWERPLSGEMYIGSGPAVDDKLVVACGRGQVNVCDAATGRLIKQLPVDGEAAGALLLDDSIVVGLCTQKGSAKPDVGLVCFNRRGYVQRWRQVVPTSDYGGYQPVPLQAGKLVLAWSGAGPLFAVDAKSGIVAWHPAGKFSDLALSPDASVAYVITAPNDRAKAADSEAAPKAEVQALDMRTGKPMWHTPIGYEGRGLTLWDDRLVVLGVQQRYKEPFVACLDCGSGEQLWKRGAGDRAWAFGQSVVPCVRNDRLVVLTDETVEARDLKDPTRVLSAVRLDRQCRERPVIAGDYAYVPCPQRGVLKFDLRTGKLAANVVPMAHDYSATLRGDRAFTLEFSGLLTAWSLADLGPAAPGAAENRDLLGVPPTDLAAALLGEFSPTAGTPPPIQGSAQRATGGNGATSLLVACVLVLGLTGAAFALRRRRDA